MAQLLKSAKNRSRDLGYLLKIQNRISFWTDFLAQIILKHHHSGGQYFAFSTTPMAWKLPIARNLGDATATAGHQGQAVATRMGGTQDVLGRLAWRFLEVSAHAAPQNFLVDPPHKKYTKNIKTTNNTYIVCFGEVYLQQIIFTRGSRSFCRKIGSTGNHQHVKIAKCLAKLIPLLSMGEKV